MTEAQFQIHVQELWRLASGFIPSERKSDAIRAIACMSYLRFHRGPGGPDGGESAPVSDVVDLAEYRTRLAA